MRSSVKGWKGNRSAGKWRWENAVKQNYGHKLSHDGAAMRILILKEEQLQQQTRSTLDVIYENWRGYNRKLQDCIVPLMNEKLLLQPASHMWPLGQIVQHIISVRAGWFSGTLQDDDEAMKGYMPWGQPDSPARSAVELVRGLDETWAFIESRLQQWTPADCAKTFPDEMDGQTYEVSRSWVIYHVMEHDLHHGSEVSLILGMNGLRALDL